MAVEISMNSKVYNKNYLYIVYQSFSPCLGLQVKCRCISWTHQLLLFFYFAAEIYFQPSFFLLFLQRTDTQQQCNNEDPIITVMGKRGSFIAVELPFAADTEYLGEIFP